MIVNFAIFFASLPYCPFDFSSFHVYEEKKEIRAQDIEMNLCQLDIATNLPTDFTSNEISIKELCV